jgi:hypothetical protein
MEGLVTPPDQAEFIDVKKIATNIAARYVDKVLSSIEAPLRREWAKRKNESVNLLAKYIARQQDRLGKVRNMLFETIPARLDDVYVQPELNADDKVLNEDHLVWRLTHLKRTVVAGVAGIGKSLLLRHLFLKLCEIDTPIFPIFLECREVNSIYDDYAKQHHSFPSLATVLFRGISDDEEHFSFQQLTEGLKQGLFCILLDGIDEAKYLDDLSNQISYFARQHPKCGMVVTSRPMLRPVGWQDFESWRIRPLDFARMQNIVIKLPLSVEVKESFLRTVTPEFFLANNTILGIPLLVGILALMFLKNARISPDAAVFYEDAFNALFNRHDATKEGFTRELKSRLSYLSLRRVLNALSALMYKDYQNTLDHYNVLIYIAKSAQLAQIDCEPEDILFDLVTNICIIMKDGNVYEFIHRSFQEFFCAHFLLSLPRDRSLAMVRQIAKRSDAANLIYLLLSISPGSVEREFVIPAINGYLRAREEQRAVDNPVQFFHELGQKDVVVGEVKFRSAYPEMFSIREALWRRDGKIDAVKELETLWAGLRLIESSANKCYRRIKSRLKTDVIGLDVVAMEMAEDLGAVWSMEYKGRIAVDYAVLKDHVDLLVEKYRDFDRDLDDLFLSQGRVV